MEKSINKTLAMPPGLVFALEDIARSRSTWAGQKTWADIAREACAKYVEQNAPLDPPLKSIRRRKGARR